MRKFGQNKKALALPPVSQNIRSNPSLHKKPNQKPTHAGCLIGAFVVQVDFALLASHPVKKLS
jgi:hypothetical protein